MGTSSSGVAANADTASPSDSASAKNAAAALFL